MAVKTASFLALAALVFVAIFTAIVLYGEEKPTAQKSTQALLPLAGTLDVEAIDDLRVGGRKIILCGVAYTRPASVRDLTKEAARREFQGKKVTCRPVGQGTPCDGRAAATFRGALVVQCLTDDGKDVAAELSARQILCDLPSQSGGHYTACP